MTIQTIIKNSIQKLRNDNESLTPKNYEKAFCEEAKKHGVVVEDCMKIDKFIKKLAPKYQNELYRRNIQTLDELFMFLTTVLNRLDKEESAAVIKAYTLLIRRVIQAAKINKDHQVQKIAQQSLNDLDPHMRLEEIEKLRVLWNDYVMNYDDSFLEPLKKYMPVNKLEYKEIIEKLLSSIDNTPKAKEGFDAIAQVVVLALVPSIASATNDKLAKISQELLKNPESLTTQGMLNDINSMVKLRIALDKEEISNQVSKLNDIIEMLSSKLQIMSKNSSESSSKIKGIRVDLENVDFSKKNFENLHEKLTNIVNSLESESKTFYEDIKEKEEEVHNLKNRVQLLEKALKKEQEKSHTDSLTKLPNRRASDTKLEELEAEFKRYQKNFSLVLFDIDKFKNINDTYGHDAGDIILSSLAKIFLKYKRDTDMFARLGGEEFIAILPFTNAQNAHTFANKIREVVQNSKFMYKGTRIDVTVSGGVVDRENVTSIKDMFKRSDKLLYKAKHSGRNNIQK